MQTTSTSAARVDDEPPPSPPCGTAGGNRRPCAGQARTHARRTRPQNEPPMAKATSPGARRAHLNRNRTSLTFSVASSLLSAGAIPFSFASTSGAPEGSGALVGASRRCWATASGACSSAGTGSSAETDLRSAKQARVARRVRTHNKKRKKKSSALVPLQSAPTRPPGDWPRAAWVAHERNGKHARTVRGCPS